MIKKYWKHLVGFGLVLGFVALAAPTSSTYLVGQFLRNGTGIITIPVANYWGIAEGGTNYSSETTNGVAYFDGTGINTGTGFVYVGGQVGIGTTPNNILELGSGVIGSISGYKGAISNNSGNSGWDVGQGSSNRGHMTWLYNATAASAYMAVGTHSGSNYLILNDEGGDVGINTTTPAYQLDVSGTLHASGNATLSGTGNSVGTITSGSWNGTSIGTGYGGTGVITSSSTGVPVISSGTWLVDSTLPVTLGGTGLATSTSAYAPIVGGTTATGNFQSANTGMQNIGSVLTSTGANSLPTFQAPGSPTFSGQVQYAIVVALSTTTVGSVSSAGTSGQVMTSNGASAYPTMQTVPGNSTVLKAPTIQTFTAAGQSPTASISTSSVCMTSVNSTVGIYPGMGIADTTHSSAITPGTYVVAIPGTCSSGQIQMSADAATTETGDGFVIGATVHTTGTISTSSVCITSVGSTSGVSPGAAIEDYTHPTAITAGIYVAAIPGSCSSGQIQMSADAATSESGDTLYFGGANYTLPTNPSPLYIQIRAIGGGGGGGGVGTSSANGNSGIPTVFSTYIAGGGSGGELGGGTASSSGQGGAGGICSGGPNISFTGGAGGYSYTTTSSQPNNTGGQGGSGVFGGAGQTTFDASVVSVGVGAANTGAGGAGGSGVQASYFGGGGGGSGCYFEQLISSPSSTYSLLVGNGGAGGTGGSFSGASGGSGIIMVEEYYQ